MLTSSVIIDGRAELITIDDDERQPCEVWTRVMGYFRPVKNFNIGKKEEHRERMEVFLNQRPVGERLLERLNQADDAVICDPCTARAA